MLSTTNPTLTINSSAPSVLANITDVAGHCVGGVGAAVKLRRLLLLLVVVVLLLLVVVVLLLVVVVAVEEVSVVVRVAAPPKPSR